MADVIAKRRLGRSPLQVAPLAFGGNVFGWTVDEARSFELLDAFVAAGFNLIDTADSYSRWVRGNHGGESETIIGRWLRSRKLRDRVIIATKVASEMGPGEKGLSRAYIRRAVERSLQRLGTDYIDLYQAHWDDPDTAVSETLEAFAELVREGKVRVLGASNFTAPRLAESLRTSAAAGYPRYESFQPWYNLYERDKFEGELAQLCREEGLGVISYFSLAAGFLTGKYRCAEDAGKSVRGKGAGKMLDQRGRRLLRALDTVAAEHKATPAQVSLAWLLARGVTAPIASATSVAQLKELLGCVELTLPAGDLQLLDDASTPAPGDAEG